MVTIEEEIMSVATYATIYHVQLLNLSFNIFG